MSVPKYLNDGNYRLTQQVGCDEISLPFSDVGDHSSVEIKRTYRVAQGSYIPALPMSRISIASGFAYLVNESEASNIGLGILEFTRTYASIPITRNWENTTIAYSKQYVSTSASYDWTTPPPAPEITEITYSTPGRVFYEFSLTPFDPLIAPRVAVLFGSVVAFGGWGLLQEGQFYPAEDSEVGIYKGKIYYRRTVAVKWSNFVRIS